MDNFGEVTLRFYLDIRGECIDKKARIIHGYIVSERYGVAFQLPNQPTKTYKFTEEGRPLEQTGNEYVFPEGSKPPCEDSNFINEFLVKVYQDAKDGKMR